MRVVVAEDVMLARERLVRRLREAGIDVVGETGDPEGLFRMVAAHVPDVAIVDIRMPPSHTHEDLQAAGRIRAQHPRVGVLLLSQSLEATYAMRLLEGHPDGIGYPAEGADTRCRRARRGTPADRRYGECVIDPTIASRLVGRHRRNDPLMELTEREREVLAPVAEGPSNAAIGSRPFVTERTVEAHTKQIFEKKGLETDPESNRRVLAVLAFRRSPGRV